MHAPGWSKAVVLALVGVALAGCADKAGPAAGGVEVDDRSGGIVGYVTDEQFLPLPGATVRLVTTDTTVATDASGSFGFSRVPPGTHELSAATGGYFAGGARVEVAAGEVGEAVLITLRPMRSVFPHKYVVQDTGMLACGTSLLLNGEPGDAAPCAFVGTLDPNLDDHELFWNLARPTSDWTELVLEMKWTPSQALLGKGLRMAWDLAGCEGLPDYRFGETQGESPLRITVKRDTIREVFTKANNTEACAAGPNSCGALECNLTSSVASEPATTRLDFDAGVTFQQDFRQAVTVFLNQGAPKGYTAFN